MRHLNAALTICTLLAMTLTCPLRADLIAFYTFEGDANDASGNGNHGTVIGATLATGYEGLAYEFDGVDDFIEIPVNFNPQVRPLLTIGGWPNTRKADSLGTIISHDSGGFDRHLTIDPRGPGNGYRYSAFTGTGVISAGPDPAPIDQWVFVSARYDSIANRMTLDVDSDRIAVNTNIGAGFGTARIGSNPGSDRERTRTHESPTSLYWRDPPASRQPSASARVNEKGTTNPMATTMEY